MASACGSRTRRMGQEPDSLPLAPTYCMGAPETTCNWRAGVEAGGRRVCTGGQVTNAKVGDGW